MRVTVGVRGLCVLQFMYELCQKTQLKMLLSIQKTKKEEKPPSFFAINMGYTLDFQRALLSSAAAGCVCYQHKQTKKLHQRHSQGCHIGKGGGG